MVCLPKVGYSFKDTALFNTFTFMLDTRVRVGAYILTEKPSYIAKTIDIFAGLDIGKFDHETVGKESAMC